MSLLIFDHYKDLISDLKDGMVTEEGLNAVAETMDRIEALEKEIDIDFILNDTPNLIKECQEGSERIKKIVVDLKNFAHPGNQEIKQVDSVKRF